MPTRSQALWPSLVTICFFVFLPPMLDADTWPTYQHDASRSGVSSDSITTELALAWSWQSPVAPRPARSEPAKRDPYNKVENLKHRADFDRVFHVVSDGDRVYFGTSVTDQVLCLSAQTGETQWSFFTEGPVRLAPTLADERLYFGADDGYVYCLDAQEGEVLWKKRIGPSDIRLAGDGRIISKWPVRTGVVIRDHVVYVAAGMFPSESVYLVALDSRTGDEIWRGTTGEYPAQGYLLASASRVYVPSGRSNPLVFDRQNGELLRVVAGSGGTYCLLTGDTLVFGPGKTGQLGIVPDQTQDQLASVQGNHMIATPTLTYIHADDKLSAIDRQAYLSLRVEQSTLQAELKAIRKAIADATLAGEQDGVNQATTEFESKNLRLARISEELPMCEKWSVPCRFPHALILVGEHLVAGGSDELAVLSVLDGSPLATVPVLGNAYGLAAAKGRLYVSTDRGVVHCFTGTTQ